MLARDSLNINPHFYLNGLIGKIIEKGRFTKREIGGRNSSVSKSYKEHDLFVKNIAKIAS